MSGFEGLHLSPLVGQTLTRLGYAPGDVYLAEVAPTAARGNNLVAVAPPAALHAAPGLAGAISAQIAGGEAGFLLVLVPEAGLDEWENLVTLFAREAGQAAHAVRSLARATRLLHSGTIRILLATPGAALALAQRSALKVDRVTGLFMAWPEMWTEDAAVTSLMQDLGRDIQRIVYTSEQDRAADLVERYARRALTVGPSTQLLPEPTPATKPLAGAVRTVLAPWGLRANAAKAVLEMLDPESSAVWTLTSHPELLPTVPPGTALHSTEVPAAQLIIAYDLPTVAQLSQLTAAGQVVLLVPPTAASWIKRVAPTAAQLRLPGASDTAAGVTQTRRARIAEVLESSSTEAGLLALAPLFERYDPANVAAALYSLWQEKPGAPAAPATMADDVMNAATARLWLGVGKKDGATANDFVGVLTKEIHFEKSRIGKIEVRELYSLVEVPAGDVETLVSKMNGVTIRRRRVTARIDRGGKAAVSGKR